MARLVLSNAPAGLRSNTAIDSLFLTPHVGSAGHAGLTSSVTASP